MNDILKDFEKRVGEFSKDLNKIPMVFVPYDIFKQYTELNTENLKQLYSMLHEINMEKNFFIDIDMGGIKFQVSGAQANSENVVKAADKMVEKFTKKFFNKADLKKLITDTNRKDADVKKGYN